jgi:hypothetical protein
MQSKAKTSCQQLADKLRHVCDRLAASPGRAIANEKQDVLRKALTNGGQVFGAFRSALLDSSEARTNLCCLVALAGVLAVSGCLCALAPRGAPRLPAPLRPPCNRLLIRRRFVWLPSDASTEKIALLHPRFPATTAGRDSCLTSLVPGTLPRESICVTFIRKIAIASTLCAWIKSRTPYPYDQIVVLAAMCLSTRLLVSECVEGR